MKMAVDAVSLGKQRVFNRRFPLMADRYMLEPTTCTLAPGWEKGRVENRLQTSRHAHQSYPAIIRRGFTVQIRTAPSEAERQRPAQARRRRRFSFLW